ncbi:MAG TPA: hypothetical protein VF710_12700 [Longimicrobium sp.]
MNAADQDAPALPDPALRRRAFAVFGVFAAADVAFVLAYRANTAGQVGASMILLGIALLAVPAAIVAMEPLRRSELRSNLGKEPGAFTWQSGLVALAIAATVVLIFHYVLGVPWRRALATPAGVGAYLAAWVPLARLQRRGVKPYWRPSVYGFLAAGVTGGLVWAAVAGEHPVQGIFKGIWWCAVQYAWVRFAMRNTALQGALSGRATPTEQSPGAA